MDWFSFWAGVVAVLALNLAFNWWNRHAPPGPSDVDPFDDDSIDP